MRNLIIIFIGLFSNQALTQDIRIFDNSWYLHDLVINGANNVPPINNEIPYVAAEFFNNGELNTGMCQEIGIGTLQYSGSSQFQVINLNFLAGGCQQNMPFNQSYSSLYINFWSANNFSYEIIDNGLNSTLTITDSNGDYAIYENKILLSVNNTSKLKFSIYPTIVKTSFNINYDSSNKILKLRIYNSFGKMVAAFEKIESNIDISNLPTGMYLVSIEFNDYNIETKKIIKL